MTTDNKLKLDEHIDNVCKKAQRKLTVLTRIQNSKIFEKLKILFQIFLILSLNIVIRTEHRSYDYSLNTVHWY